MTLDEFKKKFAQLKSKGYVKSLRKGPTGIGFTLETILGLKENNLALPDIDNIEIKSHRENTSSLITLFTFNKNAWQIKQLDAIDKYGSYDDNNRKGLYYTVSPTLNSAGLLLVVDNELLSVQHISGEKILTWNLSDIADRFIQKIPALLFISACSEEIGGEEHFHYYRAQLMRETSPDLLADLFRCGKLFIDLRLHEKTTGAKDHGTGVMIRDDELPTSARNHGTGFRIGENELPSLFKKIEDI